MDSLALNVERIPCTEKFPIKQEAYFQQFDDYKRLYECSIQTPGKFWNMIAEDFYWHNPLPTNPDEIMSYNFDVTMGPIKVNFLKGIQTNISYNLLERIINGGNGDRIAYYW